MIHNSWYTNAILVYGTTVVYLPHIDKFLAPTDGHNLRVGLVGQRLVASLDRVHRIARAGHLGRQVLKTCETGHLEESV